MENIVETGGTLMLGPRLKQERYLKEVDTPQYIGGLTDEEPIRTFECVFYNASDDDKEDLSDEPCDVYIGSATTEDIAPDAVEEDSEGDTNTAYFVFTPKRLIITYWDLGYEVVPYSSIRMFRVSTLTRDLPINGIRAVNEWIGGDLVYVDKAGHEIENYDELEFQTKEISLFTLDLHHKQLDMEFEGKYDLRDICKCINQCI